MKKLNIVYMGTPDFSVGPLEKLIEKYNVKILEKIKDKVFFKDGDTKILSKELAEKTIELSSDNLLEKIKKEILDTEYTEKWDKIRKLKRLD